MAKFLRSVEATAYHLVDEKGFDVKNDNIKYFKNLLLLYQEFADFKPSSGPILHPDEPPVLKMNWSSLGFFHTGLFGAASTLLSESLKIPVYPESASDTPITSILKQLSTGG